jgi:glycosyltransferase involved in cell wall biosynthesis
MPAYNEADALPFFLSEIQNTFAGYDLTIIVVDDHSTDETEAVAKHYTDLVFRNESNMGHGKSYLRALEIASNMNFDVVIVTDGDGQCSARDLLAISRAVTQTEPVVIGIRRGRNEPLFRKLVTLLVKLLVMLRTKKKFADPNSPHRAYHVEYLRKYLSLFTGKESIPNIIGTNHILRRGDKFQTVDILFRDRTAEVKIGSSWGGRASAPTQIPTIRFVKFCFSAFKDFVNS